MGVIECVSMVQRILNRYLSLLASISNNTHELSRRGRTIRLLIALLILLLLTLLCGRIINFKIVLGLWLWLLLGLVPYLLGVTYIFWHLMDKEILSVFMVGILTSYMAFVFGFIGAFLDERVTNFGLGYTISQALNFGAISALVFFIPMILFYLVWKLLHRR